MNAEENLESDSKRKMDIKDPIWRLNNLYKIVDKSGHKVTFKQNSVQRQLNNYTQKRRRILKARQMGISTNELLRMLDFVLFNKNKTACIIAHEQDSINKLFRIVRRAYEFMPDNLKPALDRGGGSQYSMAFPSINSRIYCDLESRSDTIHWLHISEKAFIKEIDRVHATTEAVPISGVITEESTPQGLNHFYESWMEPDSNYTNIFLPWFFLEDYQIRNTEVNSSSYTAEEKSFIKMAKAVHGVDITPGQIDFRRFKKRELKSLFVQEYSESDTTCFLTSGNNVFDLALIKPMYDKAPKPIEVVDGIRVYKRRVDKNEIYVIGADTAEGVEGDASAAHVFEVRSREQVASFHSNKIKPSEFAQVLKKMAEMYDVGYPGPLLAVERNNHGHAVILYLDEVLGYTNLFRTKKENKKTDMDEVRIGWTTDRVTRPLMIDTLIEGVEHGTITLNDKDTLAQCLTLVNNDGKIEAEEGKHDDLVIAAAISIQMCIEEGVFALYDNIAGKIKI
jgi:hypothetical protein